MREPVGRWAAGADGARVASGAMKVTLPDGTPLELPDGASGADAAAAIGPGLARAALAVSIERRRLRDLARPLQPTATPLEIVTDRSGQDALDAHPPRRRARARGRGAWSSIPGVKISIGPPIENGFYYDFEFPEGVAISDADFEAHRGEDARAHRRRRALRARGRRRSREALERFRGEGQDYKVELIEDLVATTRASTPSRSTPTARSPTSAAGRTRRAPSASRRSSCSRSPAPTGAATPTARCSPASTGRPSSTGRARRAPRAARAGARARPPQARPRARAVHLLAAVARARPSGCRRARRSSTRSSRSTAAMQQERGYVEVKTPLLYESQLWETSGHWGKYKDNIFVSEYEDREFGLKPMNCPGHCAPVRRCSTGPTATCRCATPSRACCTAASRSGTLHGLLRVRHFIQDDAHIFCTEEQIEDEVARCLAFAYDIYAHVRLPRARRALDAARRPPRRRRVLGPRRGRARQGARDTTASSTRSARARASSTRRRSTCT